MCLLTLVLAFVIALAPLAISALRATHTARTRWAPARFEAVTLLADFVDQETGERGYIITQNPTYLEPYAAGRTDAPRLLAALDRQLPPSERPLVESVRDAYASWLGIAKREMSAIDEHDPPRARAVVRTGVGKQRFDALRSRQDSLIAAVDARLNDALRTAQRANRGFVAALIAVLVLGGLAVAVSWRLLRRSLTEAKYASDLERLQSDERRRFIETLQSAVLPTIDDRDLPLALATRYLPASTTFEIGGDWYDVFVLTEGRVGLVVGDVVGRGIRAAAAMSQLRSALHAIALRCDDPAEVFARLDEFAGTHPDAFCTTAFYAIYDPAKSTLAYCNAGHPPPLVIDDGGLQYLAAGRRPPVGVTTNDSNSRAARVHLNGRTRLVVYTDGLIERRGESIDLGLARLQGAAAGLANASIDELADSLISAMIGADRADDTALLAIELAASGDARTPEPDEGAGAGARTPSRWKVAIYATGNGSLPASPTPSSRN